MDTQDDEKEFEMKCGCCGVELPKEVIWVPEYPKPFCFHCSVKCLHGKQCDKEIEE